jgi:hypothetical protein
MCRGFDRSQEAAFSVALFAVLYMRSPWEGTARELQEQLSHFITNDPPVRALERMLVARTPELYRQGIDIFRIDSPRHRTWALQFVHAPRSDLQRHRAGSAPGPGAYPRVVGVPSISLRP